MACNAHHFGRLIRGAREDMSLNQYHLCFVVAKVEKQYFLYAVVRFNRRTESTWAHNLLLLKRNNMSF